MRRTPGGGGCVVPRRPQEGLFALREWERDGDLPAEYAHGASPAPAAGPRACGRPWRGRRRRV